MKIAMFGGSFNPVHSGHTEIAKTATEKFQLDKLLVIPSGTPVHKLAPDLAADAHRVSMLELAFKDIKNAEISDIEISSTDKCYTYTTIEKLKKIYPEDELYLIIGSDMLLSFDSWYRYQNILNSVTILAASRSDKDTEIAKKKATELCGNIQFFDTDIIEVSSTDIRNGKNIHLLDGKVLEYIKRNELYND